MGRNIPLLGECRNGKERRGCYYQPGYDMILGIKQRVVASHKTHFKK